MKKFKTLIPLTALSIIILMLTSCEKDDSLSDLISIYEDSYTYTDTVTGEVITYEFRMDGRSYQDNNEYYYLNLIEEENQTLHRFGAYVTNVDYWGLPTQVIWSCDTYWEFEGNTIPIVNGTSFADPNIDSVFCMMAPIFEMQGDTITIHGQAWFEEGDIILKDSINFIFE